MRTIKFRGKRLDNGEWVYGWLTSMWRQPHILDWEDENTGYGIADTAGQFTGLLDKDGNEIYEQDIIGGIYQPEPPNTYIGNSPKSFPFIGVVEYNAAGFRIKQLNNHQSKQSRNRAYFHFADYHVTELQIIGNIHDNPDLLKTEQA